MVKTMKHELKIQTSKSVYLPYTIRKNNEKNNLKTVQWTINYEKDKVNINFLKKKHGYNANAMYRNIYGYSTVKVPNIILEHFNIKAGDNIVLDIEEDEITVTSKKKTRIKDISGILD